MTRTSSAIAADVDYTICCVVALRLNSVRTAQHMLYCHSFCGRVMHHLPCHCLESVLTLGSTTHANTGQQIQRSNPTKRATNFSFAKGILHKQHFDQTAINAQLALMECCQVLQGKTDLPGSSTKRESVSPYTTRAFHLSLASTMRIAFSRVSLADCSIRSSYQHQISQQGPE